jgi:hypothetical protein
MKVKTRKIIIKVTVINWLQRAELFWRSRHLCRYSRIPQNSAKVHYLVHKIPQDQSSPYRSILSIVILPIHLHLGLPSGLFPSGFPTRVLYTFLFSPFMLHCGSQGGVYEITTWCWYITLRITGFLELCSSSSTEVNPFWDTQQNVFSSC